MSYKGKYQKSEVINFHKENVKWLVKARDDMKVVPKKWTIGLLDECISDFEYFTEYLEKHLPDENDLLGK